MCMLRRATQSDGVSYTYPVEAWLPLNRPGWMVTKIGNNVYYLPPDTDKHLSKDYIEARLKDKGDVRAVKSFKKNCGTRNTMKSKRCIVEGVYFDGKRLFEVHKPYPVGKSTYVTFKLMSDSDVHKRHHGILVHIDNPDGDISYILYSPAEDNNSLYKHFLFSPWYVSAVIIEGHDLVEKGLPYQIVSDEVVILNNCWE